MTKPDLNIINGRINSFKGYVQKVLPAVYDDTLSYYELLSKIITHLNENGKVTNEMLDLWNEVNTWLMNEGLTESVDENIKKLVDNGTMNTIINQQVFTELDDKIKHSVSGVINAVQLYNVDNTGTTYVSDLLQTIINENPNKEIYLENGTYKINSSLLIKNYVKIKGQSKDGVILLVDGSNNPDVFLLEHGCELYDFTVQITNPNHSKAVFKYFAMTGGNRFGRVKNIKVIGTGNSDDTKVIELGVQSDAINNSAYVFFWDFEDFDIRYCKYAFYTEMDFTKGWSTAVTFDNFIMNNVVRGVYFNTPFVRGYYSRYDFTKWQFQTHAAMDRVFESPSDRSVIDIHVWDKSFYTSTPKAFLIKDISTNNKFAIRNLPASEVEFEKPISALQNEFDMSDVSESKKHYSSRNFIR